MNKQLFFILWIIGFIFLFIPGCWLLGLIMISERTIRLFREALENLREESGRQPGFLYSISYVVSMMLLIFAIDFMEFINFLTEKGGEA